MFFYSKVFKHVKFMKTLNKADIISTYIYGFVIHIITPFLSLLLLTIALIYLSDRFHAVKIFNG